MVTGRGAPRARIVAKEESLCDVHAVRVRDEGAAWARARLAGDGLVQDRPVKRVGGEGELTRGDLRILFLVEHCRERGGHGARVKREMREVRVSLSLCGCVCMRACVCIGGVWQ